MNSPRNKAVDLAKFIAAVFVVGIHTRPFSQWSTTADFVLCDILFRTAVPFFAVCTGFYLTRKMKWVAGEEKQDQRMVGKLAWKVLLMYLGWSLFYLIIQILTWYQSGTLSMQSFLDWLVLSIKGYSYYHLWYLSQLFWGLLFLYPIIRYVPVKLQYILVILLWLFGAFCHVYCDILGTGRTVVGHIGHLGALSASVGRILPLLIAGSLLARKNDSGKGSILLPIIFAGLLTLEAFFLRSQGASRFSFIVFTLPLAFVLFQWIEQLQIPLFTDTRAIAKTAMLVYLLHPAVLFLLQSFFTLNPFWTFLTTLLLTVAVSIIFGHIPYPARCGRG